MLYSKQFALVALLAISNLSGTFAVPQGSESAPAAAVAKAAVASGTYNPDLSKDAPAEEIRQSSYEAQEASIKTLREAVAEAYAVYSELKSSQEGYEASLGMAKFKVQELQELVNKAQRLTRDRRGKWEQAEKDLNAAKDRLSRAKYEAEDQRLKQERALKSTLKRSEKESSKAEKQKKEGEFRKLQAKLDQEANSDAAPKA